VEESAIEFRILRDKRALSEGWRTPRILMRQRRTLYWRLAGVEPNDAQVTNSKSVERLWRKQPSSSGLLETKEQSQKDGELQNTDAPEMFIILACSWRRAQ